MIKITREEADMMRTMVPDAHIAIVNRHHKSKRKAYYIEENRSTIPLLNRIRFIEEDRKGHKQKRG